ncbi:hybrid sensor histidine kinase/response regulator [Motilimonas eburnea]|uniref:hybrid sensor histidine kinase/response regulator n=1 Tax=Motilimonas eburnea TaxID=1737488 RepID=UPI001E2F3A34|nr:hybrid sensor histidine kinase/response regulator [Motilimonas eburnea]MCE2573326.1 hybrid sensor histidine kinase/response regulator [Motilimonas eburnea]
MDSPPCKILIVDDEPNNHRVYERILESLDIEFVNALSGQQALAVAHRHQFFLILMDVQMPEMDGFETASLLLNHPKTSHIPIIFITAFARDESFEFKGYASGAVDYLVKPINDSILKSKVSVFLELHLDKERIESAFEVQKQAQNELRQHKVMLEQMVKERTKDLQNSLSDLLSAQEQLVETEKMASLGRLVAGVAHELNTPIGVCVTAASHLEGTVKGVHSDIQAGRIGKNKLNNFIDSTSQLSSILQSNLERAATLIGNFKLVAVDISSEQNRVISVVDYLNSTISSLHPAVKNTQVDISVSGDPSIKIDTCPGNLSQVVTNLIMNSLLHAFTDEMLGIINIVVARDDEHLIIRFSDNGVGIERESLKVIFEPFFTTKRGSGGSGLGLSIVYNVVNKNLGGNIRCESEVGVGTTFIISLPLSLIAD